MAESKQEFEENEPKPKAINKCTRESCQVRAIYGIVKGEPLHCRAHAFEGMTNVVSKRKRCNEPGCATRTSFAFEHEGPRTHCPFYIISSK
jgi:hypothetical protein